MDILKIIKQEYLEFIVDYGHKFDTDIFSERPNQKIRKYLETAVFPELRNQGFPVLSNSRLVDKETLSHILKKVEKVNYNKLKNLFIYYPDVMDGLSQIDYDNEIEKYFKRLEKKGFDIGASSFIYPELIDLKDYFTASEKSEEKTIQKIRLFEGFDEEKVFNEFLKEDSTEKLRNLGSRIFDQSVIFNSKRKMYQFILLLEESSVSIKNYRVTSNNQLFKVDFDSVYIYESKLEDFLSYKNGFRKDQFKIISYKPHLLNCIDYLLYTQDILLK
jgi:hypothetical protein